MGASEWSYFVPYQVDIQKALDDLRIQVYADVVKQYPTRSQKLVELQKELDEVEDSMASEEIREFLQMDIQRQIEAIRAFFPSNTFEQQIQALRLIADWDGDGFGNILDVAQISDNAGFGVAAPLSTQELMRIFDTVQPTREMIENHRFEVTDYRRRGMGSYVVVFEKGEPTEIFFGGFSGD